MLWLLVISILGSNTVFVTPQNEGQEIHYSAPTTVRHKSAFGQQLDGCYQSPVQDHCFHLFSVSSDIFLKLTKEEMEANA